MYKVREKDGGRSRWWRTGAASKADCRADLSSSQQWENRPKWRALWGVGCGFPLGGAVLRLRSLTAQSQGLGF